jgi:hypothetical protein
MRHKRTTTGDERATRAVFSSFTRHLVGVNGFRTFYDGFELIGGRGFHEEAYEMRQ